MDTMNTVTQTLEKLKEEGYTIDFNLRSNCLECADNSLQIHPEDFQIDKFFRFEGESDPGDEAIVYAISSPKNDLKGTLVNSYGTYADDVTEELVNALKVKHD